MGRRKHTNVAANKTKATWLKINKQLAPIGAIDKKTCVVTCSINWKTHEDY